MLWRWTTLVSSLVAALALASSARAAPSFDCAKASTPVERAVCDNADLGDLDVRLAAALKEALGRSGAKRDDLLRQQREWLSKRNICVQEQNSAKTVACLQASYAGQIDRLRLFSGSVASASLPLCHAFADRVEALYQGDPTIFASTDKSNWFGRTALDVLSDDKASGLVLNNESKSYSKIEDLLDAFAKAVQPARLSQKSIAAIKDNVSDSSYIYLRHLPQTDLYVVGTVAGTASCTTHTWFDIHGTRVEPMPLSDTDQADDGTCGVDEDILGTLNNIPVRFTLAWGATPGLTSVVDIGAWVNAAWAPTCSVHLDFAPKFDLQQTLNESEKSCSLQDCGKLYDDALRLVIGVQNRQNGQIDKLPQAERERFEKMQALWRKDNPPPDSNATPATAPGPDDALDTDPLLLPSVVEDKAYLVTLGHRTVGWRIYSDWEVKFWSLAGDSLTNVATTTVGMARGKLLRANVIEPGQ